MDHAVGITANESVLNFHIESEPHAKKVSQQETLSCPIMRKTRAVKLAKSAMKILFPHARLIASSRGLEFKQGDIVKQRKPVMTPEYPWEGNLTYLYGSVVKSRIYRMWYQAHGTSVAYARSGDGLRWKKPLFERSRMDQTSAGPTIGLDDGQIEACGPRAPSVSTQSNIVRDLHMPSLIYDPQDRRRPYKLFGYTDRGYCAAFSKDGIHFKPAEQGPVIPLLKFRAPNAHKTWFSDVAPVFQDSHTGKFVSHVKTYRCDSEGKVRRCVGYAESDDFLHWSKPVTIWTPGIDDDRLATDRGSRWADFYGLCGFNYGDGYLGFLWLFYIDYEIARGTHEGKIEVFLASSTDGKTWKRFSDTALLPLSRSDWDSGMITTANQPVFDKDKILLYYGGANFTHGVGEDGHPYDQATDRFNIGLATLRKDGFVYASSSDGQFTTEPLKTKKGRINVNADCSRGRIVINVMKAGVKKKSLEMAGLDSLNKVFRISPREKIALEVTIRNARLYSVELS